MTDRYRSSCIRLIDKTRQVLRERVFRPIVAMSCRRSFPSRYQSRSTAIPRSETAVCFRRNDVRPPLLAEIGHPGERRAHDETGDAVDGPRGAWGGEGLAAESHGADVTRCGVCAGAVAQLHGGGDPVHHGRG